MTKKRIGKGLSALIPGESHETDAGTRTENPGPAPQIGPAPGIEPASKATPDIRENPPEPIQHQPKPEPSPAPPPTEVKEPDPLFVENLKKDREKRVKAIEAMNEAIRKYNTHK